MNSNKKLEIFWYIYFKDKESFEITPSRLTNQNQKNSKTTQLFTHDLLKK